jgi:hypothetical protein
VARASRLPRTLPVSEHLIMRKAFIARYVKKPAKFTNAMCPSNHYVEFRLNLMEVGEQKAESLAKVTTREVDKDDTGNLDTYVNLTVGGNIRITKAPRKGSLPTDPEELRAKIRVWGNSWTFASLRLATRAELADIDPQLFGDYADYLCGDRMMKHHCKGPGGDILSTPSMAQIIEYDFQIRSKVADLMNDGERFVDALWEAMSDKEVRDRGFFSQVVMGGLATAMTEIRSYVNTRPAHRAASPPKKYLRQDVKGAGKGKGAGKYYDPWQQKGEKGKFDKGKGKGKGTHKGRGNKTGAKGHVKGRTADHRLICFAYNDHQGCNGQSCNMVHVCSTCEGPHPAHDKSCPGFVPTRWQ